MVPRAKADQMRRRALANPVKLAGEPPSRNAIRVGRRGILLLTVNA